MVSLSFYWCTPPCGGVPGPDLGQALRFRRSEVCCFLPSAGDLQRTRVSSPGLVFDLLASFRGASNKVGDLVLAPSVVRVWVYYPCSVTVTVGGAGDGNHLVLPPNDEIVARLVLVPSDVIIVEWFEFVRGLILSPVQVGKGW
ncbi:hypothetical protein YC2023_068811 [Brassica napus]